MKQSISSQKEEVSATYIKDLHFTKCKKCGSKDLFKFDFDTYCSDCDWNSILMDVECGNFEKRIAIVNRKRNSEKKKITLPTTEAPQVAASAKQPLIPKYDDHYIPEPTAQDTDELSTNLMGA